MDTLTQLWNLLAKNPLNITLTFNVEISTGSPIEELLHSCVPDLPNLNEDYNTYSQEEVSQLGFDISKIQGGKGSA